MFAMMTSYPQRQTAVIDWLQSIILRPNILLNKVKMATKVPHTFYVHSKYAHITTVTVTTQHARYAPHYSGDPNSFG